jgi:hypothetical protein
VPVVSLFYTEALPYAQQAHARTGVLTSVILAQWRDEGNGVWPPPDNNPGNVGTFGGHVTSFGTVQAGVNAYISTMLDVDYAPVRAAQGAQAQCYALGRSPWAGSHYEASGPPPGEDLWKLVIGNRLTQYDAPQPLPPQPPTPTEDDMGVSAYEDNDSNQRHVFAQQSDGTVWHYTQQINPSVPTWSVEVLPKP